jgi:hypothetical protein
MHNLILAQQKQKKGIINNITSHVTNFANEIDAKEVAMRFMPHIISFLLNPKQ